MKHGIIYVLVLVAGTVIGSTTQIFHSTFKSTLAALGLSAPVAPAQANVNGHDSPKSDDHGHKGEDKHDGPEGHIKLTAKQLTAAKIDVKAVGPGTITHGVTVPATVRPDPERVTWVAANVVGTITKLQKRLGDPVKQGDLLAVIESREVADAKSQYLAARAKYGLQKVLYEREDTLFKKKIIAEQRYLLTRMTTTEARLLYDLARQKLLALKFRNEEINNIGKDNGLTLSRKHIRAPSEGVITERRVANGEPVGGEGQKKVLYVISDLSSVWVELSVPASELNEIRQGLSVLAYSGTTRLKGAVVFVNPNLDQATRSAHVIAKFPNHKFLLRSGAFLTAQIIIKETKVDVVIPQTAVQKIEGENVVFVRNPLGFEKREVVIGAKDSKNIEIVFGLEVGEKIAVTNSFTLKADLGKTEAGHAH